MPALLTVVGYVAFFIIIFASFTLFPRIVFIFIKRLLTFKDWTTFFSLISHSKDVFIVYIVLTFPLAIIYRSVVTGDFHTVSTSIILFLIALRLSVLLKKKHFIEKIGFSTSLILLEDFDRKQIKAEYVSYLFDVFLSAFIVGIIILSVEIFSLPTNELISIPSFIVYNKDVISEIGKLVLYLATLFLITMFSELSLRLFGSYKMDE